MLFILILFYYIIIITIILLYAIIILFYFSYIYFFSNNKNVFYAFSFSNNNPDCLLFWFVRGKQDPFDGDATTCKNSFNNPAYYILEGVPNQSALASDLLPGSALPPLANKTAAPVGGVGKNKPPSGSSAQGRWQTGGRPVRPISEEGSSEDDGNIGPHVGSLNRPPPDFPPPPLPKGALEMADNSFGKPRMFPDLADVKIPPPSAVPSKPLSSPSFVSPPGGGVAFCLETPPMLNPTPAPFRRGGGASGLDDQSCSVLQMAKTLSEVEYPSGRERSGVVKGPAAPHMRGLTFPPRSIQEESIAEDLPEEVRTNRRTPALTAVVIMN